MMQVPHSHNEASTEPVNTAEKMRKKRYNANLVLNSDSSMSEFLKSSIGPSTMKASREPAGNVCRKVAATKASEVEHRESTKASPIMNR
ncbi:hypothetical protein D3C75_1277940 [compost metagenome]